MDVAQKLEMARQAAHWMRELGVDVVEVPGELTIRLGAQPVPNVPPEVEQKLTELTEEPDDYDALNEEWNRRGAA